MTSKSGLLLIVVSAAILFTSGCATFTTGRYQKVPVDSNPQGANVTVSTGNHDVTPCSFDLERGKECTIKIGKEGYKTSQITLKKEMCGSTAGNVILGGIIGLGVDAMSGAMFKLVPEKVYVDLVPGKSEEVVIIEPPKEVKATPPPKQSPPPQTNFNKNTNSAP